MSNDGIHFKESDATAEPSRAEPSRAEPFRSYHARPIPPGVAIWCVDNIAVHKGRAARFAVISPAAALPYFNVAKVAAYFKLIYTFASDLGR